MSDHISGPRALAEPIADITDVYAFPSPERPGPSRAGDEHAAVRQAVGRALGRAHLPVPAASARPPGAPDEPAPFAVGETRVRVRLRLLRRRHRRRRAPVEQDGTCTTPAGETVSFRVNDERGGAAARRAGVRRPALGSVHHGRAGGAEDDRHRRAGVHRSRVDLPRRQERPQPRRRDRRRAAGRRRAGRCRRRDADPRHVQRADRTGRAARGEEHDARLRSSSIR